MDITRIFLIVTAISLVVGVVPAFAEKQYKMSCYEWCAKKDVFTGSLRDGT